MINYEKICPVCGIMLDYVFELDKDPVVVGYWCHMCNYHQSYTVKNYYEEHQEEFRGSEKKFNKEQDGE